MEFTVNKVKNPWYNNNFTLFFEIFQFSFQPFGSLEGRYITLPVFFNYTINWAEPMASLMGGCEGLAWAKTKYADKTIDFPDIEFSRISFCFWNTSVWQWIFDPLQSRCHGRSLGKVLQVNCQHWHVASDSHVSPPAISTVELSGWLRQIRTQLHLLTQSISVTNRNRISTFSLKEPKLDWLLAEAFQKMGTKFYDKVFPGCESYTP